MSISLETWRRSASEKTREIFEPDGLLSQVIREISVKGGNFSDQTFIHQPEQARMAGNCAATYVKGEAEGKSAISFHQASTGIGKGLAYGVPAAIHASLTGRRVIIATHTIALQRQWTKKDGQIAEIIAERVTGKRPVVAVHRGMRSFVSIDRSERQVETLRAQADRASTGAEAVVLRSQADALERLAIYVTKVQIKVRTLAGEKEALDQLQGLIETFAEQSPDDWEILSEIPIERYCLASRDPQDERVLYKAYSQKAKVADVLVTTHAAAVIDLKFGCLIGKSGERLAAVVFDEADHLPEVARSILTSKHSIGAMNDDVAAVMAFATTDGVPENIRLAFDGASKSLQAKIDNLMVHLRDQGEKLHDRVELRIEKGDQVVDALTSISGSLVDLNKAIFATGMPLFNEVIDSLDHQIFVIGEFLDEVKRDPKDRFSQPIVSYSPMRHLPSIALMPRSHRMLISRLWKNTNPRADSIVFTSATLATPGVSEAKIFDEMVEQVGLSKRRELVLRDLSSVYEPKDFGQMKFMLASPKAPLPERDEPGTLSAAIVYSASAIVQASTEKSGRGTANVLVLTKSHIAAKLLEGELKEKLGNRVRARQTAESLQDCVEWFLEEKDRVLVTAGAWEGLDIPNYIDHIVIARLPYDPPARGNWQQPTDEDRVPYAASKMMRMLKQGIGRGLRRASDEVTIWICDPRFGLPTELAADLMVTAHPKSQKHFLDCVESRFRKALRRAGIIEIPNEHVEHPKPLKGNKPKRKIAA